MAILYDHDVFGGEKQRVRGSFNSDRTQESPCVNLSGANDNLTSLKIIKDKAAHGYWQAITSTESQLYSFHVGVNYSNSAGTNTEIQESISAGLSLGVNFGFVNAEVSVDTEYSALIAQDVESTYGVDYGISNETTCSTPDDDPKGGVGLYQWII